MKKMRIIFALLFSTSLIASGILSCGGGSSDTATDTFASASTINVLNATPTGSGKGNVNFTASNSSGTPLLASLLSPDTNFSVKIALMNLFIREAWADVTGSGGLTCTITAPASTTSCDIDTITSTAGIAGAGGTVAAAEIIDNTGSMAGADPTGIRGTAAKSFIDILGTASVSNWIAVFDFETSLAALSPFLFTNNMRVDFPWAQTSVANVALAKAQVVVVDGGATNLFDTILNVCMDMNSAATVTLATPAPGTAAHFASAAAPVGAATNSSAIDVADAKTMLILTDGGDNASTSGATSALSLDNAIACLQAANIVAFTVGLGSGIDAQAELDLQAIAAANAGGVYVSTSDAATLLPIFNAIAGAATTGFNTAGITILPAPTVGDTVTGTITSSAGGTGTFTYVQD